MEIHRLRNICRLASLPLRPGGFTLLSGEGRTYDDEGSLSCDMLSRVPVCARAAGGFVHVAETNQSRRLQYSDLSWTHDVVSRLHSLGYMPQVH